MTRLSSAQVGQVIPNTSSASAISVASSSSASESSPSSVCVPPGDAFQVQALQRWP